MVRVVSLFALKRLLVLRLLLMHIHVKVAETRKLTGASLGRIFLTIGG